MKKYRTYSELLKDVKWKRKRMRILRRDHFQCTVCGSKESLRVHHTYYVEGKLPWRYPENSLLTLCENCHYKWHTEHETEVRARKKHSRHTAPRAKKKVEIPLAKIQEGRTRFRRKTPDGWIIITVETALTS